jgi:hypothetical protein
VGWRLERNRYGGSKPLGLTPGDSIAAAAAEKKARESAVENLIYSGEFSVVENVDLLEGAQSDANWSLRGL